MMRISIEEFNAVVNNGLDDKFKLTIGNWLASNGFVCKSAIEADMLTTSLLQAVEAAIVDEFRNRE